MGGYRLLAAVAGVTLLMGLAMVLLPGVTLQAFGLMIYRDAAAMPAQFPPEALRYIQLVHAVLGATIVGWAVLIGGVVVGALRRGESRALLWLTASIAAWFVPDTAYSLISGYWQNAVFNLLFAAAFGVALWQGARRRTPAMSRSER